MQNETIVITGGSSGIGAASARSLAEMGAHVAITGRSAETDRLASEIGADAFRADFARLSEVRDLAAQLLARCPRIDVLVNNAGAIYTDRQLTEDGHEKTLQVNHLAPFLLTKLLRDRLEQSRAVVIDTSSGANNFGRLDFDDLESAKSFSAFWAYGATKLMNILHAMEISRRFEGVSAASFHPGSVATRWAREGSTVLRWIYESPLRHLLLISPEKGADTLLWLIRGEPGRDWRPGEYYQKRKPGRRNAAATVANAERLWSASEALVGE